MPDVAHGRSVGPTTELEDVKLLRPAPGKAVVDVREQIISYRPGHTFGSEHRHFRHRNDEPAAAPAEFALLRENLGGKIPGQ